MWNRRAWVGGKCISVKTTLDDAGGKSVSEKSTSAGGKWWRRDAEFDEEYSKGGQTDHRTSERKV